MATSRMQTQTEVPDAPPNPPDPRDGPVRTPPIPPPLPTDEPQPKPVQDPPAEEDPRPPLIVAHITVVRFCSIPNQARFGYRVGPCASSWIFGVAPRSLHSPTG